MQLRNGKITAKNIKVSNIVNMTERKEEKKDETIVLPSLDKDVALIAHEVENSDSEKMKVLQGYINEALNGTAEKYAKIQKITIVYKYLLENKETFKKDKFKPKFHVTLRGKVAEHKNNLTGILAVETDKDKRALALELYYYVDYVTNLITM